MTQSEFRKQLGEITNNNLPRSQPTLIDKLKSQYDHSINLIGNRNFVDTTKDCFKFVFEDIIPKSSWKIIEEKHQENNEITESLISNLILSGFLALHDEQEKSDNIVVYFHDDKPKHFGKIEGNKFVSKWGVGLVWRHGLFEIPHPYGNKAKYSSDQINCEILQKVISSN